MEIQPCTLKHIDRNFELGNFAVAILNKNVVYRYPVYVSQMTPLVATSADSVSSSYLVRITIAPIGTTFGNLQ